MSRNERNKLIEDNLKLVPYVVHKHFKGYISISEEKRDDLISEGYIYLCKAADRYDTNLGYTFSTYAVRYIWGSLSRYVKYEIRKDEQNKQLRYLEAIIPGTDNMKLVDILDCEDDGLSIIELKEFISSRVKIIDKEKIISMLKCGYTRTSIAKELKISPQGLDCRLKKLKKAIYEEYLAS